MPSRALLVLLLVGCAEPEPVVLVDHTTWAPLEADVDPFDDRPEVVVCPSSAWGPEIDEEAFTEGGRTAFALEIDTSLCNYFFGCHDTLVDLNAGDEVTVRLSHDVLTADEPAQGHAVLRLGEVDLVDTHIDIPGPEDSDAWTVTIPDDVPAGTPLWLHLHNHGPNSWTLHELEVTAHGG